MHYDEDQDFALPVQAKNATELEKRPSTDTLPSEHVDIRDSSQSSGNNNEYRLIMDQWLV